MQRLCQYKDLLGEPRKGVHSIRIFDFAVVDIFLTIVAAIIITAFISLFIQIMTQNISITLGTTVLMFILILCMLVISGIFLHWFFCVDTKLNGLLGL